MIRSRPFNFAAWLLVIYFAIWFQSCDSKDDPREILARIDTTSIIDLSYGKWRIGKKLAEPSLIRYRLDRVESDTLDMLHLTTYDDVSLLSHYTRKFPCGSDTCVLDLFRNGDTTWYYRQNSEEKKFIVGEYYYKYALGKMDVHQFDYFTQHEDSLRKVKGNNLPNLPVSED